jgi:hypothetical protein
VVDAGAPTGWQADVASAISQGQGATGLHFVDVGTFSSGAQVPAGTGITIAWVSALPAGADDVGLTTYYYVDDSAYTPQMTKADIELLRSLHVGGGEGGELPVLLHEMGHALGLGHVPDQPDVMNPVDQGYTEYQPGDLNGLRLLGAAEGCAGFYS